MGAGLVLIWAAVGGSLMRRYRLALADFPRRFESRWRLAFIVTGAVLASIEEAVACAMTNLRSVFGDPTGTAFITASGNYLDLVFRHSVIVIIPMLAVWAWLLSRYRFTPGRTYLLFGAQGALAEVVFTGMPVVLMTVWLHVYGLMIWLPALAFSPAAERSGRRRDPGVMANLLALIAPLIGGFLFTAAFLAVTKAVSPHPDSHFPPPIE